MEAREEDERKLKESKLRKKKTFRNDGGQRIEERIGKKK